MNPQSPVENVLRDRNRSSVNARDVAKKKNKNTHNLSYIFGSLLSNVKIISLLF